MIIGEVFLHRKMITQIEFIDLRWRLAWSSFSLQPVLDFQISLQWILNPEWDIIYPGSHNN